MAEIRIKNLKVKHARKPCMELVAGLQPSASIMGALHTVDIFVHYKVDKS